MPLEILHQRSGRIEPHRLAIQQRRQERRGVVRLQVGAGIHKQGKTGCVRFGKAIQRKRGDRTHDTLFRLPLNAVGAQAHAELGFDGFHAFH